MTTDILLQRHRAILSILVMCSSYFLYNIVDALMKLHVSSMHVSQFLSFMFLAQFLPAVVIGWKREGKKSLTTKHPKYMAFRLIMGQIGMASTALALPHLELTTFYMLVFTGPLWIALIASYMLKDKMDKNRIGVILVGFCSVLYALNPAGGITANIWSFLILFCVFIASFDLIMIRKMGESESKYFMLTSSVVLGLVIHLPIMFFNYTPISMEVLFFIGLLGVLKMTAFLMKIYAFQNASSAAVVAPLHYTQIVWGTIIGYLLFNEVPTQQTTVSAFIIVMSGIYLIYCEKNIKHEEAK